MQGFEQQGDRVCRRCHAHYNSYGAYPDDNDLQRLADKSARIAGYADNPPPPGHRENPECGHDGDSKWHWSSKHKFYICNACKIFARDNDDELRVPQRHKRTESREGLPCADDLCQSTTATKWAWEESLRALVAPVRNSRRETSAGQIESPAQMVGSGRVLNKPEHARSSINEIPLSMAIRGQEYSDFWTRK